MRVGIDGNLLCGKKTGMGVVLFNILSRIRFKDEHQLILYVPDKLEHEMEYLISRNNIKIQILVKKNYILWEQKVLPKQVIIDKLDIFWFPFNTGSISIKCKKVVTIHDLIFMYGNPLDPPTLYKKLGKLYRRLIVPQIIRSSDKIITISKTAKNEIVDKFPNFESNVFIAYNGYEKNDFELNQKEWEEFKINKNLNTKYILGFGSLEKRKNTLRVIRAFEIFSRDNTGYKLVLFGFRGFEKSREYTYINESKIKNIIILGYISDKEKNSLYKNSECFVFPSLFEGFGIPILEAFNNKTLVITSNISSMPEVAGDAAIYINPNSVESIVKGLKDAVSMEVEREKKINKGLQRLSLFSWEESAKIISSVLEINK